MNGSEALPSSEDALNMAQAIIGDTTYQQEAEINEMYHTHENLGTPLHELDIADWQEINR